MTIQLHRKKNENDINEFWNDNDQLCERLRDLEDRSFDSQHILNNDE